jgi:phosphoribosyl 1,2-cyclic phosphodiesterase
MGGHELTVYGARGSIPAPSRDRLRYGGNTTCFGLSLGDDHVLLIDAGTGLAFAGDLLRRGPTVYDVLITHYHMDHLLGLQSFRPFFDPVNTFTFFGMVPEQGTIEGAIGGVFASPWFPVQLPDIPCGRHYVELDGSPFTVADVEVTTTPLRHPQGVLAYRLERGDRTVVIATDHEADHGPQDEALVELSRGADVLIHDAQYTPDELETQYDGWGHSTWQDAVRVATAAGVSELVLTSHDPYRPDAGIDAIVDAARREFPHVVGAYEGLSIPM